jgi:tyrosinase
MSGKVRKDVWKLDHWDPILVWYAKGIAEMQKRPVTDPTSWRYQAAIHDYVRENDPLAKKGEKMPADSDRFWMQCQHHSWFFLPWHRMYLACFEQIVAAAVKQLGGPDWALPYWNYSDPDNAYARKVPPAFRSPKLPDGSPNALFVQERAPDCNAGNEIADDVDVDISRCLSASKFAAAAHGGSVGFGGPQTKFNHGEGRVGFVEATPHNTIHGAVGGNDGYMGAFETAALDPLFWIHHCNIDRLWEVWRTRNEQHADPSGGVWSSFKFEIHNSSGKIIKFTAADMVDTTSARLDYTYEDTSDPLEAVAEIAKAPMAEQPVPEMVGATEKPIKISKGGATTTLAISEPKGPAHAEMAVSMRRRVYLNIENVTGAGAANYRVYVNLPDKADPKQHREYLAGVLPTFGVREASRKDEKHAGSGLHVTLEITDLVQRLSERDAWDPKSLKVSFVPRKEGAADIQVGRVSLYYS